MNTVKAIIERKASRLLWWVVAAFVIQISVWAAWLIFASRHRVEEVPLVTEARGS